VTAAGLLKQFYYVVVIKKEVDHFEVQSYENFMDFYVKWVGRPGQKFRNHNTEYSIFF
jgi:hypothetical protein